MSGQSRGGGDSWKTNFCITHWMTGNWETLHGFCSSRSNFRRILQCLWYQMTTRYKSIKKKQALFLSCKLLVFFFFESLQFQYLVLATEEAQSLAEIESCSLFVSCFYLPLMSLFVILVLDALYSEKGHSGTRSDAGEISRRLGRACTSSRWMPPSFSSSSEWELLISNRYSDRSHLDHNIKISSRMEKIAKWALQYKMYVYLLGLIATEHHWKNLVGVVTYLQAGWVHPDNRSFKNSVGCMTVLSMGG